MSAEQPQSAPPATPPSAPPEKKRSGGASVGALIGIGVVVILLSFVASFLGAKAAQPADSAEPTPTPHGSAEYVAALEEILPAGSAVRAGTGSPVGEVGYEGDVYIDISTSDVYVFRDGEWVLGGNIRQSAAENLTGETGPAGETGDTGATGAPGEPGTQLVLGIGAPADETCTTDGDVYIDTESLEFYECAAQKWTLFGPEPDPDVTPPPAG